MAFGQSVSGAGGAALCTIVKKPFGTVAGSEADLYTLTNSNGYEVKITNFGGIITSFKAPDRKGIIADIVLGFNDLETYVKGHPYFGCIIGRYGNRIAKGQFTLEGKKYILAQNNGTNNLHGGPDGFDKRLWKAREIRGPGSVGLELTYISKDGEEGFPGTLTATVTYTLDRNNDFRIDYGATTDKTTLANLTNHSYFNLGGEGSGDILETIVTINADKFTPVDANQIPTGELKNVSGTPMDFRKPGPIGARIKDSDEQLAFGGGYDHNWVLKKAAAATDPVSLAATAHDPKSGRVLEVLTTEPGVQMYTGNFLDGTHVGKAGKPYSHRSGFCFETQHFPDSPNHPEFPSTVLKPGEVYNSTTIFRLSAK
jgi:aldose 1-epimerase